MIDIRDVNKILRDHERRLSTLERKRVVGNKAEQKSWYKPGSTIGKILTLVSEGFFNRPRSIGEMVSELKTKDYHLKASDVTLPLRKIVRKGILRKTKKYQDGKQSKKWLYVKV